MIRTIDAFVVDDVGDWVAELSCLHRQHVRHRPPFWDRPWVLTAEGRDSRVGSDIDCPLCDRPELPDGLVLARTAGPFVETTLPAALRRDHRIADRTWGRLRVTEGSIAFTMATTPPIDVVLEASDTHPIPPGVAHALHVRGPVVVVVDFLVSAGRPS